MIDITNKYTYNWMEVVSIDCYPTPHHKFWYLVVVLDNQGSYWSHWIAEDDPDLVEVKPEPETITLWYNAFRCATGSKKRITLGRVVGCDTEDEARKGVSSYQGYIGTFPMEITLPTEEE